MKRILMASIAALSSFLLLTGCGILNIQELTGETTSETQETTSETQSSVEIPVGAIFPVMADEANAVKSREISLTDFTFTIPDGYVYGKVDYEGYSTYYVWQDKQDKEYVLESDRDIMLYIYDGLDSNSPHKTLTNTQARISIRTGYMNSFTNLVEARNLFADADVTLSDDESYFVYCFTGNSGEYLATTYSVYCYPKTYYGIYTLSTQTTGSDRRYYGFIFSNDEEGEIFKESEYNNLFSQVKSNFNISEFYSEGLVDVSAGRSYEQLVGDYDSVPAVEGLFHDTLIYYVESIKRDYERENVDGKAESTETAIETELTEDDMNTDGDKKD